MVLTDKARGKEVKRAVAAAETVARAVNLARDWVNTPASDLTPVMFADAVAGHRSEGKVKVTVLDEKELARQGCGGILGVGQGSDNPPRLVQLEYSPRKPAAHLALVGKGITFDSGGLSLKTGTGMMTMKCDMGGAAAVLAATYAIAELGVPVKVTAFASMAENMPSGKATRPGDVLTMRNGATVEVLNTDAEGRLVLADALDMAAEAKPDLVVDVATLTGACVVALGTRVAGVMSNDDRLRERVPQVAGRAGEAMWSLPIPEEMKTKVTSSTVADLRQHNPEPYGGSAVRRRVPARVRPGPPLGAPRHRRSGVQRQGAVRLHAEGRHGYRRADAGTTGAGGCVRRGARRGLSRVRSCPSDGGSTPASAPARRRRPRHSWGPPACWPSRGPTWPTAPGAASTRRRPRPAAACSR